MNKILKEKININMINIISFYTLPLKLSSRKLLYKQLIDNTYSINISLTHGGCYNKNGFWYPYAKGKIKHIIGKNNLNFWTIRY